METAIFGAGCFWGVEDAFRKTNGVQATAVGYAGGHTEDPTYKQVCSGTTGHAEVTKVDFDPDAVSYQELLDVFWKCHNPTTLNRQGPDIGSQYRSVIFCTSPEQQSLAEQSKQEWDASDRYPEPIVTEILPAPEFYMAEDYHQQYFEKTGRSSCHL